MKKSIIVSFIISCFLISVLHAQNKGGRWQFDGNGFDTAAWDNVDDSGVLQGTASYDNVNPIEGNWYLNLDSLDVKDYFKIEDSADLDFTDENIGISAWIYPFVLNDVHFIVTKGDNLASQRSTNYALRISNSKKLEFLIRDSNNAAKKVASSFSIPANEWSFIASYYDYANSKVYMWNDPNSDPVDTLSFAHSFFANDAPLAIGAWFNSDSANPTVKEYSGRIDDVRISGNLSDLFSPTSVSEQVVLPSEFELKQNYPNPFNPTTKIDFTIARSEHILLEIFNINGSRVKTVLKKTLEPGSYSYNFNAQYLPSGIYYYRLKTKDYEVIKQMILLK